MTAPLRTVTCDEASELSGLYVLGALDEPDRSAVAQHLASCPRAHDEFAQAGSVVPALATAAAPAGAPAALKRRVLDAYRQDMAGAAATATAPVIRPSASRRPAWYGWAAAAAALLIVAVVGAWGFTARADADRANQRATELSSAIAALSAPGSSVALLRGSGAAAGANGFAAFPEDGGGYVVMTDLPSAPAGQAYQAWYIADGTPASAGLLSVGPDGYAVLSDAQPVPGTQVVALTLEPAGGSVAPTTDPIAVGQVSSPA